MWTLFLLYYFFMPFVLFGQFICSDYNSFHLRCLPAECLFTAFLLYSFSLYVKPVLNSIHTPPAIRLHAWFILLECTPMFAIATTSRETNNDNSFYKKNLNCNLLLLRKSLLCTLLMAVCKVIFNKIS